MNKNTLRLYILLLPFVISLNYSNAATATATLSISVGIMPQCTITANPLVFATYTGAVETAQTTLVSQCTLGTSVALTLDAGANSPDTVARRMLGTDGTTYLSYTLYTDSGYTTEWTPSTTVPLTGGGATPTTTDIYAQIVAAQTVSSQEYLDTVTATLSF